MTDAQRILEFEHYVKNFYPSCTTDERDKELCKCILEMVKAYYASLFIRHDGFDYYVNCPHCQKPIRIVFCQEKKHGIEVELDPPEVVTE